jgi:outer membrane immunogenic protein
MNTRFGWALASAMLLGNVGAAMAADMPLKVKASPPVAVYNWTGFYVGGDVGGYWDNQSATVVSSPSPGFGAPPIGGAGIAGFGNLPTNHGLNRDGAVGGVYAGYNWQLGKFLVGVEADVSALGRQTVTNTQTVLATFPAVPAAAYTMTVSASNDWLATARARAGFVAGPALWYVTGGAAWTRTSYSANAAGLANPAAGINTTGQTAASAWSDSKTGFVVGGGLEWMFKPNWVLRGEYLYHEFSGSSSTMPVVGLAAGGGNTCVGGGGAAQCNFTTNTSTQRISVARVGIAYKFGGPVVAKY